MMRTDYIQARERMVEEQLVSRGIHDPRVLRAMAKVPRHLFLENELWDQAYEDHPLPIGADQTISQPYIVAFMTQALELPASGQALVLEIGAGSGYQAAILSYLAAQVYSVERLDALAQQAQAVLQKLNIHNVTIKVDDGGYGWPTHGPYEAIIVAAAAPDVPPPLIDQLKEGGRLVAPVGPKWQQELVRLRRKHGKIIRENLAPVTFVPLLGEHGWAEDEYFD